jgi:hypothetical protein
MGGFLLRKWILTAVIMALPTCALAQIQSGVQSRVQSGVHNGFDYHQRRPEKVYHLRYSYSSCWRALVARHRVIVVWNCQPYPPP